MGEMFMRCSNNRKGLEKGHPAEKLKILFICDDPGNFKQVEDILTLSGAIDFGIQRAASADVALNMLEKDDYNAVLMDMGNAIGKGLHSLKKVADREQSLPIVILAARDDEAAAITALQKNAADYLVKEHLNGPVLIRSIRYAIERKKIEKILRESEEDLKRAQAVAQTGSWRLDVRRNELLWSDETYRIFGIPRGTPMTYEKFLACVQFEDRERVDREWQAAMRGEPYDIEHRITVGKKMKWVRERAELEFDDEGTLRGGFGTVQDVTERKTLERRIERLHREQEAFMRHEVKNLFTPIQIYADMLMLESANLTGKQIHYLHRIAGNVERITRFIDSLKRIHDLETGTYRLKCEEYNLDDIIQQVISDMEPIAEKNGVTIRYRPKRKKCVMPVEAQLMSGVFTNLILNAVEHVANLREPEGKIVTVDFRKERERCIIRINNKGEPVSPERLASFFEKFNSGKEKRQGAGLGTTYAYLAVKAHGGDVTVSSSRAEGTTVTVIL